MIKITSHPKWIEELLEFIEPFKERVVRSQIFDELTVGHLSLRRLRGGLINFYPLIEGFPKYLALSLAKVPPGNIARNRKARYWLIRNINQERVHTAWWKQWAEGFGLRQVDFDKEIYPPVGMDAINHYLWRVCTHGSLAEGISASNFAMEGATGEWTKRVIGGLRKYKRVKSVSLNDKSLEWVSAHAGYDDRHPVEALEIIKAFAQTEEEQDRVKQAARQALEYYSLALESCYEIFKG